MANVTKATFEPYKTKSAANRKERLGKAVLTLDDGKTEVLRQVTRKDYYKWAQAAFPKK